MTSPADIEKKFWKALKSDMTLMLGVDGLEDGHTRPMTAQLEHEERGPIWFFTSIDTDLGQATERGRELSALMMLTAKGHELFATLGGRLRQDNDPAVIDRLWNPFVAAWYEGGQTDPKLRLLRLEPGVAEIWENGSSVLAGIKTLLGIDPKDDYRDQAKKVRLGKG